MPSNAAATARKGTSDRTKDEASNGQRGRPPEAHEGGITARLPHLRMPGGTAGTVMWWGGLATVAALGIVDWPVAALIAAGTWVADQHLKQARQAQRPRASGV
jgi:hypothetical protein